MGATQAAWAFATAAAVFVLLLITGSLLVSSMTTEMLRPVRMTGPTVRRWGGFVLLVVGLWFVVLAVAPSPILGS